MTAPEPAPVRTWSLRTHWALLVAALLLSLVWFLPILLGYYGIVDPGLTYRSSPAEASSTPWAKLTTGDANTISSFARILGVGVILIGVAGLLVTWWPMLQGRPYAIVAVLVASAVILAIGAYFHINGYWDTWPLATVILTWGAGALAAGIWLGVHRGEFTARARRRAGRGVS